MASGRPYVMQKDRTKYLWWSSECKSWDFTEGLVVPLILLSWQLPSCYYCCPTGEDLAHREMLHPVETGHLTKPGLSKSTKSTPCSFSFLSQNLQILSLCFEHPKRCESRIADLYWQGYHATSALTRNPLIESKKFRWLRQLFRFWGIYPGCLHRFISFQVKHKNSASWVEYGHLNHFWLCEQDIPNFKCMQLQLKKKSTL